MMRPAPSDRPRLDAALERLLGEQMTACSASASSSLNFEARVARLVKKGRDAVLPRKGERFPAHWEHVDLPPAGSAPMDICSLSPRARDYLINFRTVMLKDSAEVEDNPGLTPFMDVHFRETIHLRRLAGRMARAGMVRRVPSSQAEVCL